MQPGPHPGLWPEQALLQPPFAGDRPDQMTGDLFADRVDSAGKAQRVQWEKVSDLVDTLRGAHGAKAMSLGAHEDVRGGYLGAKIAFGRIPDKADFNAAPSRDEDTHFCKV